MRAYSKNNIKTPLRLHGVVVHGVPRRHHPRQPPARVRARRRRRVRPDAHRPAHRHPQWHRRLARLFFLTKIFENDRKSRHLHSQPSISHPGKK